MRPVLHPVPARVKMALSLVAFLALGWTLLQSSSLTASQNPSTSTSSKAIRSIPESNLLADLHRGKHKKTNTSRDEGKAMSSFAPTTFHGPRLVQLTSDLEKKMDVLEPEREIKNLTTACKELHIHHKETCADGAPDCPQTVLPESLEARIQQLAFRPNLQVPQKYRDVIRDMAAAIPGYYDVILVSAFSSNHFMEAQAMLMNIHEKVFPVLKNFTFVVYDLGLTEAQRDEVRTYCRCTLLPFPFERFPEHFQVLKCFSWKVTVIRAMYERADLVIWTDASIRIRDPDTLVEFMVRARRRGIQQRFQTSGVPNPYFTLSQMFHFFGDSPCAHMAFHQVETGYGLYHKEPLVTHAVLDPWYGCAVRAACMCPVNQRAVQICPNFRGATHVGLCMRNEQSAISIILAKLFREKYRAIVVNVGSFQVAVREHKYPYFDELRRRQT